MFKGQSTYKGRLSIKSLTKNHWDQEQRVTAWPKVKVKRTLNGGFYIGIISQVPKIQNVCWKKHAIMLFYLAIQGLK